ncbi:hypothetical protein BM607_004005 [Shewanella sp. SACH]|uniref:DUF1643 domain-containing protein n=1 Tax=Shewanella TaxID=22 RepID=UPI0009033EE4|nr:DUF1643 domain-containing protein [Shewanella sp. SACH]OUS53099.1 hypothetical protein BM607_004005 [Shewanella sp. SACH]
MSTKFEVTGLFYESNGYKLRKYLDIKRVGVALSEPDLMVVMMNPGSSYPLDGIDNNSVSSEAEPDTTQQQIMKVMDAAAFNYARILNLSDLRTPDSNELYRFLKSKECSSVKHSIFSPNRKLELAQLFVNGVPVIYGWGVDQALIPLAKQAIETLCINDPLGILKPNTRYSYYHPLPRIYAKQLEWVQHVTSQSSLTAKAAAV